MKIPTPSLLFLLGATKACHAFVVAPRRVTTATALASEPPAATTVSKENDPDKHQLQPVFPPYAKPDPKGPLGKIGDVPEDKHKLTQVFPTFAKPDPVGPLGKVGNDKTKGLQPVFPTFGTPEPSASLGQVGELSPLRNDKHKLTPVFPAYEQQPLAKPSLGHVGGSNKKKKGLHNDFPDFGTPPAKPELGQVGDNASKKKGLDSVFPTWEK